MAKFTFLGVDIECDFSGKRYLEERAMADRYLELDQCSASYDYENMTEEQEAEGRERTDLFCTLYYERNVQFDFH